MTSPFEIVTQTSNQLVVHSPMLLFDWVIWAPLLVGNAILLFVYTQMPKGLTFFLRHLPLWIAVLLTGLFLVSGIWSHTMRLSRPDGTAVLEHRFAGLNYSTQRIELKALERATLESARPGTRIAVIVRGGEPVWPFGKGYNPRPNEYAVIDDINDFIGRKSNLNTDDLERRMEQKFKDLENPATAPATKGVPPR